MEIKVMQDILGQNDRVAALIHARMAERRVFVLNLLGSPGAGKTSLLEKTMAALSEKIKMAVIEGDLFTSRDADRIARYGVPVLQINTAGGCHLDASMIEKATHDMAVDALDLLIIENVGNLVCPAEFALGEDAKVVVLSVTEGNDKPMKYPLVFKESAVAILNKVDLVPYTDFNVDEAIEDITTIHPGARVFPLSARTGEGMDAWFSWLLEEVRAKKGDA